MLRLLLFNCLLASALFVSAQKYTVESSTITFFSDASIEDIKGNNTKALSILNATTGDVAFVIPIKDFEFEKALMKEHFNETYLESEKYPKASFQGKLFGYNPQSTDEQPVNTKGKLTIHGVTREVDISGSLETVDGKLIAKSKFMIHLNDYKVKIPKLLWQNIAEDVEVTVEFIYKPL